jgi:hypothetical protein
MKSVTVRQIITGGFGYGENFPQKHGDSNLDTWPETSASRFIWFLHNADMFDRVITCDETSCFQYDPETKRKKMQ